MLEINLFYLCTGFQCEEHDNPADFFLDVVTSCETPEIAADSGMCSC